MVPVGKVVHLLVTGADVIHSWAMPSFGVKIDAVPGRLNESWFRVEKEGVYFGQCSELCGRNHSFMPITVKAVSPEAYDAWLNWAIDEYGGTRPEATPAAAEAPAGGAAAAEPPATPAAGPASGRAGRRTSGRCSGRRTSGRSLRPPNLRPLLRPPNLRPPLRPPNLRRRPRPAPSLRHPRRRRPGRPRPTEAGG